MIRMMAAAAGPGPRAGPSLAAATAGPRAGSSRAWQGPRHTRAWRRRLPPLTRTAGPAASPCRDGEFGPRRRPLAQVTGQGLTARTRRRRAGPGTVTVTRASDCGSP
jgi:hypothetical protein